VTGSLDGEGRQVETGSAYDHLRKSVEDDFGVSAESVSHPHPLTIRLKSFLTLASIP
jgi:hypothetical protein